MVASLIAVSLRVSKMFQLGGRKGVSHLRTAWLQAESSCQGSESCSEFLPLFRLRHHPHLETTGRTGHSLKEVTAGSS